MLARLSIEIIMKRIPISLFLILPLVLLTGACSGLLPEARNQSTPLASFDEARAAIEALVPMKTQRKELEQGHFNPSTHPNIKLLTQADVVRRFLPSALVKRHWRLARPSHAGRHA